MYGSYKNLFNSSDSEEDYTEEEKAIEEAIRQDKKDNFKWLSIVDKLAGSDITKHNEVYDINYIHALNMLGFWKHMDKQKQDNK